MLGRYFGRRFLGAVGAVFFLCVGLIAIVDFFEMTRRLSDRPGTSIEDVALLVFLRLPSFTEQMLPFAVLIGAMKERADRIEATLFRDRATFMQSSTDGVWVRQQSVDGQAIIQAQASSEQGRALTNVRVFSFDKNGEFVARAEARSARLEPGQWVLSQARVQGANSEPREYDSYPIATNLTAEQVQGALASPDSLSFWDLPMVISLTERAGLKADHYRLKFQALLARPLLLVAMVAIAAAVSLRVFRLGGVGKMILGGVLAGFLLYVSTKLAEELGEGGILYPAVAAWFPVVLGALTGCLVLLYQEDG
jgi:lipopolysaccharide export system permease protein